MPTPLLRQWQGILDNFSLPYVTVDGDVADFDASDAIVLTTYDYAAANLEATGAVAWDVVAFDETHRLSKCCETDNRAAKLKVAFKDAYKLLLTASPMRNSIMLQESLVECTEEQFWERLDERAKQYLTDIDTLDFEDEARFFVEEPCDFTGQDSFALEQIKTWVDSQCPSETQRINM